MIRNVTMTNFAMFAQASVDMHEYLIMMTGQTGAGKSLLLKAIRFVCGEKGNASWVRHNAEKATVDMLFEIPTKAHADKLSEILSESVSTGEEWLVSRTLTSQGRSQAKINGRPVTLAMLKAAASILIDIHGQDDTGLLRQSRAQLEALDQIAGLTSDAAVVTQWQEQLAETKGLYKEFIAASERLKHKDEREQMLQHRLQDIAQVAPEIGEFEDLIRKEKYLSQATHIQKACDVVLAALDGSNQATGAVMNLKEALKGLEALKDFDEKLVPLYEQINEAYTVVQEVSFDVASYQQSQDSEGTHLIEVQQRMAQLSQLARRYGNATDLASDPMVAVLNLVDKMEEELFLLSGGEAEVQKLEKAFLTAVDQLIKQSLPMYEMRQEAAKVFAPLLESQLKDLDIKNPEIDIQIENNVNKTKLLQGDFTGCYAKGADTCHFWIRLNPGHPKYKLENIASGGEVARLVLSIKAVLANYGGMLGPSVCVFDELDASIGGRLGNAVGMRLASIAKGGTQVLCITHLPQVAAFAQQHVRITKHSADNNVDMTYSSLQTLDKQNILEELAEMNGTTGQLKQAEQMIENANK